MKKIIKLMKKYKEVIMYLIFGVLTTLINIVSFYIMDKLGISLYVNNTIAWILSVLFAFVTNKLFVFESKDMKPKVILKEGISFFGFRLLSYFVDMFCIFLLVDVFKVNKLIAKVVGNVIVIIINYIFSKLFIFKKEAK